MEWICRCGHQNTLHPHVCSECAEIRPENCPECGSDRVEMLALNAERDRYCLDCEAAFSSAFDYGYVSYEG